MAGVLLFFKWLWNQRLTSALTRVWWWCPYHLDVEEVVCWNNKNLRFINFSQSALQWSSVHVYRGQEVSPCPKPHVTCTKDSVISEGATRRVCRLYLACVCVWGVLYLIFCDFIFSSLVLELLKCCFEVRERWVFKALTETQLATLLLYWSVFVLRHGDELRHTTLNNLHTFNLNPNRVQSCVLSSLQTNSGWGEEICPVVCTKPWWSNCKPDLALIRYKWAREIRCVTIHTIWFKFDMIFNPAKINTALGFRFQMI